MTGKIVLVSSLPVGVEVTSDVGAIVVASVVVAASLGVLTVGVGFGSTSVREIEGISYF